MIARVVAPALLAVVAVVLALPGTGRVRHRVERLVGTDRRRRPWGPLRRSRAGRAGDHDPSAALAATVVAVAAELRAGRAPADAWRAGARVPVGPDGVPAQQDLLRALGVPGAGPVPGGPPPWGSEGAGGPGRIPRARRPLPPAQRRSVLRHVRTVRAATRLAGELGAPLAGVLEACARSVQADADAETAVRGALAGPQHTTRLLTWLPVLGLLVGGLLGARPHTVLLDGGAGSLAGGTGVLLTLAGRAWVARMVAAARDPAPGGGRGG